MVVWAALCLSWIILAFFFLFMGRPSTGRSWLLQWGSLAVGVLVWGTAVYATLNHWPPPLIGNLRVNWIFASWVGVSALSFVVYGYDKRAVAVKVTGIAEWVFYLLSFWGGWAGAFAAQYLLSHKNEGVGHQVVTAVMMLANVVLWTWIGSQT
ncbi:MAG: DUF1294 domain-containing protein [Chloroflexi bacterium]|nr:DUF1294 domain-containing protein [Ardenticatenaceae bacterium]MBL1129198.1 DUF1294 domain-containing protein [Chloroflexota bacterium]NOG35274.1 DUF1294 domain-containing protein [Chloroflexota bacterium]GIK58439.1 MAG: hypothetical protein BroJett015_41020 [Chloroflexota bacterium]